MGIKAVLFDLDGTLLNRDESVKFFIESQYERLGMTLNHSKRKLCVSFHSTR
ncbi:putative hydrolase of the HAD superfamily [Lysinibacillus fusiformis]|uniref:Putative hydrolase of the HAD superfamily n=1 Tax=Lysinibacillus fusiformis TaxID=28031 RepID=A0A1H8ZRA9_9BACI|nr:putative hydrolase of the HAD superfamily [Lysinibacillus fusiformis]SEM86169.1 putative hydrolase of the HAD superfamily [Lysinibacillus fusiformis]SEP66915.1 putative hydrolase of the HAD superfamily [Lysinibacillus fusiformis]